MSTEYYLRRAPKACPTCGHDPMVEDVHIGHSAGGWVFLWQGWRTAEGSPAGRPLDTAEAWFAFLAEEVERGGAIVDEYGSSRPLWWFVQLVAESRAQDRPARVRLDLVRPSVEHIDGDDFDFRRSP